MKILMIMMMMVKVDHQFIGDEAPTLPGNNPEYRTYLTSVLGGLNLFMNHEIQEF